MGKFDLLNQLASFQAISVLQYYISSDFEYKPIFFLTCTSLTYEVYA